MRVRPGARTSLSERIQDGFEDFAASSPARFAITIFAVLVLVFTGLLALPMSHADGETIPFSDALFTAVSVICVTGLATVDMATYWSPFGHVVIFVGVEIGAIGVLTVASILGLAISRKLSLRQRLIAAGDSNPLRIQRGPVAEGQAVRLGDIGGLLVTIAVSMIAIEVVIALLLLPRVLPESNGFGEALWISSYFSVMSFTNTGFVLSPGGLDPFVSDPWFLSVMMLSVFLGAVGFPVIYTLARNFRRPRRWSLHTKLTLLTTGILFVGGAIAFFGLEYSNPQTFGSMDAGQTALQAAFLSMMARSGGFATIDVAEMNGSSLLITDMLMFVGGGSASTAGGIKVTTLAILFLAAFAEARGNSSIEAFHRRIPSDVLRVSVSIVLWGATIVAVATVALTRITGAPLDLVLFDVISAFATCGLSTGFTAEAPESAHYILAATMFMGRIGTVTFAAALAATTRRQLYQNAEERPIVG